MNFQPDGLKLEENFSSHLRATPCQPIPAIVTGTFPRTLGDSQQTNTHSRNGFLVLLSPSQQNTFAYAGRVRIAEAASTRQFKRFIEKNVIANVPG
jgi:hypothetical protein